MENIIRKLYEFTKKSKLKNDYYGNKTYLNFNYIKECGEEFFSDVYLSYERDLSKYIIDNINYILDNLDYLVEKKILENFTQGGDKNYYFIDKRECKEYLFLPNRIEKYFRKYSQTITILLTFIGSSVFWTLLIYIFNLIK